MYTYWETRFKKEGVLWSTEPSDSAIAAVELFKSQKIRKILIPGYGYGRNAGVFIKNGFDVTGIEISNTAVELAKTIGLQCKVHCGSVNSMPFDDEKYDGIFCYALIHLLNRAERKKFLQACYNQLNMNGIMVFIVASTQMSLFGTGKRISKNRYEISKGLQVYFYNDESVKKEFSDFGLLWASDIEEPVKYLENEDPIKLKRIVCKKK